MDKTRELLRLTKEGNEAAREQIILNNVGLIWSVVRRFTNRGYESEDLFQIGSIGLMKAVDKFDLSYDVKFSTYAVPMIIGEVRRYLRDNNTIRVSRSVRDLAYKALQTKERMSAERGCDATLEDVAREMGESLESVTSAIESIAAPVSLYDPVYNDGGDSIYVMDQVKDDSNTDEVWLEDIALKEAMKKLSEREKKIISMRFYGGRTQTEIAEEIGISQAQVSRLEKGAIEHIRRQM